MASRRDAHQAHQQAVAALGKNLSRRARSRCELCEASTRLSVVEVAGGPEEPEEDWAVMVCADCAQALEGRDPRSDAELRFLEGAAWSEIVPVQVTAVRLAKQLAERQVTWAVDLVDGLYLDPDVEARI